MNSIDKMFIVFIVTMSIFALLLFSDDISKVFSSDGDVVRNYDRSIVSDVITTSEPNTGSIGVLVLDNLLRYPTHIRVYKNGEFIQSVYMSEGKYSFLNLEYGIYRFEVNDPDYVTWWCDAFPAQNDYDNIIGDVKLSPEINTVSYLIYGDNPKTRMSGLESSPKWYDKSATPTGRYLSQHVKNLYGLLGIR